jgi:hypothetical protein
MARPPVTSEPSEHLTSTPDSDLYPTAAGEAMLDVESRIGSGTKVGLIGDPGGSRCGAPRSRRRRATSIT